MEGSGYSYMRRLLGEPRHNRERNDGSLDETRHPPRHSSEEPMTRHTQNRLVRCVKSALRLRRLAWKLGPFAKLRHASLASPKPASSRPPDLLASPSTLRMDREAESFHARRRKVPDDHTAERIRVIRGSHMRNANFPTWLSHANTFE